MILGPSMSGPELLPQVRGVHKMTRFGQNATRKLVSAANIDHFSPTPAPEHLENRLYKAGSGSGSPPDPDPDPPDPDPFPDPDPDPKV